jgi:hypothetical protein
MAGFVVGAALVLVALGVAGFRASGFVVGVALGVAGFLAADDPFVARAFAVVAAFALCFAGAFRAGLAGAFHPGSAGAAPGVVVRSGSGAAGPRFSLRRWGRVEGSDPITPRRGSSLMRSMIAVVCERPDGPDGTPRSNLRPRSGAIRGPS